MYDLVIKNGRLLDTTLGIDAALDLAVSGGRIAKLGQIPAAEAKEVVDAAGCIVTPGLTDYHAHIFYRTSDFCMPAEVGLFSSGVTTVVDGGSAGCSNYEGFYQDIVCRSILNVRTFLHVSSAGQPTQTHYENVDPANFNRKKIAALCEKYRGNIVGLKLRGQQNIVREFGLKPLKAAVEIAGEVGLRLSVHVSDSPGEVRDTLDLLRPGDIFCHVYHQRGKHILDERGDLLPEVRAARERGVLFDAAHGSMQFSLNVAGRAIAQGFLPDIISSDLSLMSMYRRPVYSLSHIMSEHLNLGMSFPQILKCMTTTPAALLGMEDGVLAVGKPADIAVFQIEERSVHFRDSYGNEFDGDRLIAPQMTLKDGVPVYRRHDFF